MRLAERSLLPRRADHAVARHRHEKDPAAQGPKVRMTLS
jgi:hypothetical protein